MRDACTRSLAIGLQCLFVWRSRRVSNKGKLGIEDAPLGKVGGFIQALCTVGVINYISAPSLD